MLKKISNITNVTCPAYNIPVVMMLVVPYTNTESHRIRGSLGTLAVTENFTILLQAIQDKLDQLRYTGHENSIHLQQHCPVVLTRLRRFRFTKSRISSPSPTSCPMTCMVRGTRSPEAMLPCATKIREKKHCMLVAATMHRYNCLLRLRLLH